MALTSANTETGQKGQIVPEILTGNGYRESLGKPVRSVPQPSIGELKLTKAELITACDTFRARAQQAHDDARAARNQVLLLTAQLNTLRAAYEPPNRTRPTLTDAAGNPEPKLPTTDAEQE